MKIELEIKKAQVLLRNGEDIISLTLNAPTPYPELKYPPQAEIKTRFDFGKEWCEKVLGIIPEIINMRTHNYKILL